MRELTDKEIEQVGGGANAKLVSNFLNISSPIALCNVADFREQINRAMAQLEAMAESVS